MFDALYSGVRPYFDPTTPYFLGTRAGRLAYLSPEPPTQAASADPRLAGTLVTPGLIDCHTHLVFAGDRAEEFRRRLHGVSYQTIAAEGGGILSTVTATRAASEEALFDLALPRIQALIAEGVTRVEIKSGYGLTLPDELKCLRVARALGERLPVRISTTLLAAHAVPPEFKGQPDPYIDHVCEVILPAAAQSGLADAVDVFTEGIGFSLDQTRRVFDAATAHGLSIKGHMEQLSNLGGSVLAAQMGALSVDHLEYLDEVGVKALAASGTVATLLPGAFLFLRETTLPPIDALRAHGVPMAVSTDLNPGTSPYASLRLMMNLACVLFRLTPEEALAGVTEHAATALGLTDEGRLTLGCRADLCFFDIESPAALAYEQGAHRLVSRMFNGELPHG